MSALYRRYRPLTFQEVVGQEHVKEPLLRAIREGRLAQAYLFSGPRGVGKTTTARLLAMAVGCQGKDPPCGACPYCQAVQKGAHPDVVEIDAASNNSVEDVRELRERILLAPLSAPKKVFILDEAHMLSKSAFNALLKTLEEPPPHVLFVFATTEPERMPPTILSRTQHFRFRRLTEEEIAQKLKRILKELGREAEEEALLLLGRLADGAMRDAESLLDRLLLLEGPLTRAKVEEALGLPPKEALFRLAEALARGEAQKALEEARRLYAQGFAPRSLVGGLMETFREALYAGFGLGGKALPLDPDRLLAALTALDEALERLAKRSDLLALEASLLRAGQALTPARTGPPEPRPGETPAPPQAAGEEGASEPLRPEEPDLRERWRAFLEGLRPTLRAFVREATPVLEGNTLRLCFPEEKAFHYKRATEQKARLLPLAQAHFGVEEVAFSLEKKSPLTAEPPPRTPPAPEAEGPPLEEDPEARLRQLARRLGGRLLWVRRPKAKEEPLSEDEIGGNGI
ncbi:DNA polymerase III subunit gamma/tau [Thermus composti]|uniref:DNA polymerase III subunit gamma/tau n=1 Tax=Thermus composti TaxID=532059 RepID=A0ABV6PZ36_9DEIN|nr:DNA polymerase III subunit gamma/tau [Thermus composti]GGN03183.1 DNA polymerase III subunit gamma/tau [Thermus composti]